MSQDLDPPCRRGAELKAGKRHPSDTAARLMFKLCAPGQHAGFAPSVAQSPSMIGLDGDTGGLFGPRNVVSRRLYSRPIGSATNATPHGGAMLLRAADWGRGSAHFSAAFGTRGMSCGRGHGIPSVRTQVRNGSTSNRGGWSECFGVHLQSESRSVTEFSARQGGSRCDPRDPPR